MTTCSPHAEECGEVNEPEAAGEIGIHPPAPDALGDEDLPTALKLVIDSLAELSVYLSGTDHLTDRRRHTLLRTK